MSPARVRVGVSGWRYPAWRRGAFYPEGLPQRRELAWLARRMDSVEINGSVRLFARSRSPRDAARVTALRPPPRKGRDVYVYLDNDAEGHAPHDALRLRRRLGRVGGS